MRSNLPRRPAAVEASRKLATRPLTGLRCAVSVLDEQGVDVSSALAARLRSLGATTDLE